MNRIFLSWILYLELPFLVLNFHQQFVFEVFELFEQGVQPVVHAQSRMENHESHLAVTGQGYAPAAFRQSGTDRLTQLLAQLPELSVADELTAFFVPKPVAERFETGEQRDGFHRLKQWLGVMAFLQVVIGNARAEMVDVMEPDVAGEPLQDFGSL